MTEAERIATWLESPYASRHSNEAAAFLRSQAAEIEALRSLVERCRPSVVRDIADIERFLIRKGHVNPPDTEWLETTQDVLNRIDAAITKELTP